MLNRRLILLSLIMVGLALALLFDSNSSSSSDGARPAGAQAPRLRDDAGSRHPVTPDILDIRARKSLSEVRDAFSTRSWVPRPTAPATATLIARPELPPLPFNYLGKQSKNGQLMLFLADARQTYIAVPGAMLGDIYQVERVEPHQVAMKHLPSGETQILSIGSE
jgi:hypothetical protein